MNTLFPFSLEMVANNSYININVINLSFRTAAGSGGIGSSAT